VGVFGTVSDLVPGGRAATRARVAGVFNGLRYIVRTGNQWRFMPGEAAVQIARMCQVVGGEGAFGLLRGKHGIPDRGRSLTLDPQSIQGELIFVDTAEQFYASDRDSGRFEVLKAKHRPGSRLDAAVILLDQVVQIL
jgi:hypothetical protein